MKDRLKRFILTLSLLAAMLSIAGCAQQSGTSMTPEEEASMGYMAETMFQQVISMPDESINELIAQYSEQQDTVMVNGLNAWLSSEEDLGEYIGVSGTTVTKDSDGYSALVLAEFELRDLEFTLGMNERQTKITNLSFSPVYTTGELLMEGLGNLIIGMGVVFVVLIFLAWVISLFKYVHVFAERAENAKEQKASEEKEEPVVTVLPAQPAVASGSQDDEMAAVIAAAIAAYEADTGRHYDELMNGITVRKIRRGRR